MRARELVVSCDTQGCNGVMQRTALKSTKGVPVVCWLTEDEQIMFKMFCSKCGHEIMFIYPIMQLLFDCPKDRRNL